MIIILKKIIKKGGTKDMKKWTKKMKKGENGITLVVLVITIIVLLILAGVTISALSGENRNII